MRFNPFIYLNICFIFLVEIEKIIDSPKTLNRDSIVLRESVFTPVIILINSYFICLKYEYKVVIGT